MVPSGKYKLLGPYLKIWATEISLITSFYVEKTAEALILAALNTGISKPGRRKAQDGMAFLYYISGHEWHNLIPVA